ncbi:hypothetical protein [Rubrivirga marina]|uniref:Uncharacterized protein n=1 Tax=Rubrivirga marina TaxID=1196024 RepID=A0A271J6B1_9BACT|nr:hypothetical protein [Rubrivirga marina]PAP78495.1 hypothetical protein BSZ37_19730 [Rubrivirga marina]
MRLLTLAALAFFAAPLFAQEPVTLRPGHPDLMTADLTLGDETVSVAATGARRRDLGTLTTTVQKNDDTVTLSTDADIPQAGQVYDVSSTFAWPSLRPISRERTSRGSSGTTTYDGATVTGSFASGDDFAALPFDITLRQEPFQPEVLPLIVRSLPFAEGYTAVVPTFTSESRVRDYTLSVTGMEEVTPTGGQPVMAWAVEQTGSGTRPPRPQTYYVDPATRTIVQTTTQATGDALIVSEPVTEESLAALEAEAATPAVELRPGLDRLETDVLMSRSQDFVIRVVEPVQQEAGTLTWSAEVDQAAGTITGRLVQDISIAGQRIEQTTVAAYPSLAPVSGSTTANTNTVEVTYGDGAATVVVNGETEEVPFDAPVFDGALLFEIVRALPYEEGYRGEIHMLAPGQGVVAVPISVGAPTEIDGQTAWPVETGGGPGTAFVFYVAPETREFVRIEQEPQPGVLIHVEPVEE